MVAAAGLALDGHGVVPVVDAAAASRCRPDWAPWFGRNVGRIGRPGLEGPTSYVVVPMQEDSTCRVNVAHKD